ncbi:hypothetical protein RGQ29_002404 [Quercus rubra]|uniref:Uncharacterized protein n=1 Tax=Quercus rubra TaxID=3512 RepID=A0AAN7IDP1_QUERU|nr:hypothetical protein RGQ29_002404 [Quercus rubra]
MLPCCWNHNLNAPTSVNWVYLVSLRQCIKIPDNSSAVQILYYGFLT